MSGTCLGTHFFALSLQEDLTSFEFYRFHPKLNGSSCDSFPFFQKPKPKIEQVKKQYFPSKAKELESCKGKNQLKLVFTKHES